MKIKMIWASDPNGYIGEDNKLLQTCSTDMIHFKKYTTGNGNNAIVMGRKTWESIGSYPLPKRLNIVLTKNQYWKFNKRLGDKLLNCHKSMSIHNVLATCKEHNIKELWVIGGKEVYEQFYELADELVITNYNEYAEVHGNEIQFLPVLYPQFKPVNSSDFEDILTGSITTWRREQ